jgi:hypothetical protein
VERHPGWREKVIKSGLLLQFLEYAKQGLIAFHQEIDPSDIEIVGKKFLGKIWGATPHTWKKFLKFFLFFLEPLAQGASAKVLKAKVKGKTVAIKVFDRQHIGFSIEEFRRELAILW